MYDMICLTSQDPMTSLVLENREKYIAALQDSTQRPFVVPCPERPKEPRSQLRLLRGFQKALILILKHILYSIKS